MKTDKHHIRFTYDRAWFGRIELDGQELPNVVEASVRLRAGRQPVVELTMVMDSLEVDLETRQVNANVQLPIPELPDED